MDQPFEFGICLLNSIALREEPSDQSVLISQMLYGESCKILYKEGNWAKIHLDDDHQEGWVRTIQIELIEASQYETMIGSPKIYCNEMVTYLTDEESQLHLISLGAILPNFKSQKVTINGRVYEYDGEVTTGVLQKTAVVNTAYKFLNAPFLFGGKTPFGIDAGGFTQMVYKICGHSLLRHADQQASQGEVLSFIEESEPGDLAFFDNEEGEIIHCGILLANNHIIHCHEKVRVDRIDQSGIYNVDSRRHTHRLRVMKQLF